MVKRPNTTGCEPVIRGFEPHYPPHIERTTLIQCYQGIFNALGDLNYGKTSGFIWFEPNFVILRAVFEEYKVELKLIFKE